MPIVLAIIAAAAAIYAGAQQKKAAQYTADTYAADAKAKKDKAALDAEQHRDLVRRYLSSQRALIGKAGLEESGSALLGLEETAGQGEFDALVIRYGGDVAAARSTSAATLARAQGKAAQTASVIRAGGSLLGTYYDSTGSTSTSTSTSTARPATI